MVFTSHPKSLESNKENIKTLKFSYLDLRDSLKNKP